MQRWKQCLRQTDKQGEARRHQYLARRAPGGAANHFTQLPEILESRRQINQVWFALVALSVLFLQSSGRADIPPLPSAYSTVPAPWTEVRLDTAVFTQAPLLNETYPRQRTGTSVTSADIRIDVYPTFFWVRQLLVLRGGEHSEPNLTLGLAESLPIGDRTIRLSEAGTRLPISQLQIKIDGQQVTPRLLVGQLCEQLPKIPDDLARRHELNTCFVPAQARRTSLSEPLTDQPGRALAGSRYGADGRTNVWWLWEVPIIEHKERVLELEYMQSPYHYVEWLNGQLPDTDQPQSLRGRAFYSLQPFSLWQGTVTKLTITLQLHGLNSDFIQMQGLPPLHRSSDTLRWEFKEFEPKDVASIGMRLSVPNLYLPGRQTVSASYLSPDVPISMRLHDYLTRFFAQPKRPTGREVDLFIATFMTAAEQTADRNGQAYARLVLESLREQLLEYEEKEEQNVWSVSQCLASMSPARAAPREEAQLRKQIELRQGYMWMNLVPPDNPSWALPAPRPQPLGYTNEKTPSGLRKSTVSAWNLRTLHQRPWRPRAWRLLFSEPVESPFVDACRERQRWQLCLRLLLVGLALLLTGFGLLLVRRIRRGPTTQR